MARSRLSRAANRFRSQLLKEEEKTGTALLEAYGPVYQRLSILVDGITAEVIQLQAKGEDISRNLIYQRTRLLSLLGQIESELLVFSAFGNAQVALSQAVAVEQAQAASQALIETALGPIPGGGQIPTNFLRFNPKAVEKFVGRASNGSPLQELFATLTEEPTQAVEQVFIQGIIQGKNPREVAKELKEQFQVPLHRAQTISRTEILNSYRESSREFYQQNEDVVIRWRWQAAFQSRTCAMCLAMDGREFDTKIEMGTHPNCRCVLVPVTKTWAELGFGEDAKEGRTPVGDRGEEWFAAQDPATQLRILGPGKLKLYKEAKLTLRTLVGVRRDRDWGLSRHERSLRSIRRGTFKPKREDWGIIPPN